jgi:hypothetical protein
VDKNLADKSNMGSRQSFETPSQREIGGEEIKVRRLYNTEIGRVSNPFGLANPAPAVVPLPEGRRNPTFDNP